MEWHYFLGAGEHAEALIRRGTQRWEVVRENRRQLMEEYGADGLALDGEGAVIGLEYRRRFHTPWLRLLTPAGRGYLYLPRRNTIEGTRLAAAFERRDVAFSMSDFLLEEIGMRRRFVASFGVIGFVKFEASAAISQDERKVLAAIPGGREKCPAAIDPFPTPPDWMREVGEETYAGERR